MSSKTGNRGENLTAKADEHRGVQLHQQNVDRKIFQIFIRTHTPGCADGRWWEAA